MILSLGFQIVFLGALASLSSFSLAKVGPLEDKDGSSSGLQLTQGDLLAAANDLDTGDSSISSLESLDDMSKRSGAQWNKLHGGWGKRAGAQWNKLHGGWGKRAENWNRLNAVWGKRPERGWNNLSNMWGKRAAQWNNLNGMWGKRDWNDGNRGAGQSAQWNNLRGMWGKRSADLMDMADMFEPTVHKTV